MLEDGVREFRVNDMQWRLLGSSSDSFLPVLPWLQRCFHTVTRALLYHSVDAYFFACYAALTCEEEQRRHGLESWMQKKLVRPILEDRYDRIQEG